MLRPRRTRRIGRAFRRLGAGSARDFVALALAVGLLLTIKAALSFLPFRQVAAAVERIASAVARPRRAPVAPSRMIRAVRAAGRRMFPDKPCLPEALAAVFLYRLRGIPADLRIGVALPGDSGLEAHAWVESQGRIVIGDRPGSPAYTPLPSFPLNQPSARRV